MHTISAISSNSQEEVNARKRDLRKHAFKIRIRNLTLQILLAIVIFGSWEFLADQQIIDKFFFSSPSAIFLHIVNWFTEGTSQGPLYIHFIVTFEETILSFIIGVTLGVFGGYILGRNELLSVVLGPYIQMLNALPRVVLAPIFILWLGLGMPSKIALGVTLTFFIVFFNAFQGVREVDKNLVNNARLLGANNRQLARHVIVPSALTWILSSLHSSFGFALVGAVVGEFIGSTKGLGFLISQAQGAFDTAGVFAGMVLLSITALAANWAVHKLEKRFIAWRYVRQ
ncbi:NitT/TauT family transport system permease protein [Paenibacillus sp. yr247]|uniref:ABC transporter permease n=1 Tax=Paenibacillus sp. yr247 TaxID=1761880 RepID=UPI0008839299|nr:ABC transporter permease [Paenibacillus sp. yr247]SDM82103.1 NitT/TauT family transport system permease protein [Paenibacillus sp. yr247]